jgi:hypothetical protein
MVQKITRKKYPDEFKEEAGRARVFETGTARGYGGFRIIGGIGKTVSTILKNTAGRRTSQRTVYQHYQ